MNRFFQGLSYNLTGLRYFTTHPHLWKFAVLPFCINITVFAGLFTYYITHFSAVMQLGGQVVAGFDVLDPIGFWANVLDGLYWVLRALFTVVFFLLSLVLTFLAAALTSQLVNANFYEAMSERILIDEGILPERPFAAKRALTDLGHSLSVEVQKFALFAVATVVLLALALLPVIGTVFAVLQILVTSWIIAFGLSTFPMIKQGGTFRQIVRWGIGRKLLLAGFGLPAIIPFLGLLLTSFQVVGGTLLFRDEQRLENPPTSPPTHP